MRFFKYMIVLAFFGLWTQTTTFAADSVAWHSYDQIEKEGSAAKKVFIYFYADWCGYCRKMDKETFTDPAVAAFINENFLPVRVNTDKQNKIAARYAISGLPDLRFLTPQGEAIARWPGFIEPKQLLPMLKFIQSDSYLKMGYKEFLKQEQ